MALARRFKITLYDAVYVKLSRRLKCMLVTADKKLYGKIKSLKTAELP
jgi:predicted nucleic acid-binding protein